MGADELYGHRAVFLDRDGVINRNVLNPATGEYESPLTEDQLDILPGALDAMRELCGMGFRLFLVSNQPNYAKGKSSLETLAAIHDRLLTVLAREGIDFTAFYYCFHHPQGVVAGYSGNCVCRKPSPHFLLQASEDFGVDLGRSWMVGDRPTDVECGKLAGAKTILIQSDHEGGDGRRCGPHPDGRAPDLPGATRLIMADETVIHANGCEARTLVAGDKSVHL
jgi:D-glycero-D-manno-heptose 1,7-bisphosphate phosphatase